MPRYEVFDNDEVHLRTRKQAAHLVDTAAFAVGLTLGVAALGVMQWIPLSAAGALIALIWTGVALWIAVRRRRLRRVAWCIKLSDQRFVSYNYTRKATPLDWDRVGRVDLNDRALVIVGPAHDLIEIPHLFPDFPALSHAIVRQAEEHGVPVTIEGQPWEQLDVYSLFPFLTDDSSTGTAGAAA